MGICESKPNKESSGSNFQTKTNDPKLPECIIEKKTFQDNNYHNIDRYVAKVSRSICKLKAENETEIIRGSGFLLKFEINKEYFYCLMTNEHVITKEMINDHIININN